MVSIDELWKEERCPLVDGVYFYDGSAVVMECVLGLWVRPLVRTNLDAISEFNAHLMAELNELNVGKSIDGSFEAYCGEGSHGSEGFVCLRRADVALVWLAYFHNSNPFVQVDIVGEDVVARSNHGHVWCFPIKSPEMPRVDWNA